MMTGSCTSCALAQATDPRAVRDLETILSQVEDRARSRVPDWESDWIHVPEVDQEPWGISPIQWTREQVEEFRIARDSVIEMIRQVSGASTGAVNRMLLDANARPNLPPVGSIREFVDKTANLLRLYREEVSRAKPKPSKALFVGLALGGLALVTTAIAVGSRR